MTIREVRRSGLEYLALATELLQRARLADARWGVWEAADLQWWWRLPRASDSIEQLFWLDDEGPVAAVVLTQWRHAWGCDPLLVPGSSVPLSRVWEGALAAIDALDLAVVDTLARDDDGELRELLAGSGFVSAGEPYGMTWMDAADRPEPASLPRGFRLVDRTGTAHRRHPMARRNGEAVEMRLRQTSLYDPELDLAVETVEGEAAGYALFWFDPVTKVGLVEPMRVEDTFQRRGVARALLTDGIDRLARRGAHRLKVGFISDAARALYTSAGFRVTATGSTYTRRNPRAS
jgi:predicted N-acetyltransferase YhbS